jgi:hypothetical protein
MKYCFFGITLMSLAYNTMSAQRQTMAQMKAAIETSPNPMAYIKTVLKKKFQLDTVIIPNITYFSGTYDSIAYHGKLRKVYGPYQKKYLVQVLGKLPNTFNRISQIFIDTSAFYNRTADSLADMIVQKINTNQASFEDMSMTYSMGGEATTKGDVGWIAKGALIPEIETALANRKRGEVFKVWTKSGVHIIKKTNNAKQDSGVTLLLIIYL